MSSLAFDRAGSGPVLVLMHPLGADRRVWRPVLGRLTAQRECIAVDLPGFGESPPLPGSAHPRDLAAAVGTLLGKLGVAPGEAHIAGNSLGGWVALESALRGDAASVTAIAPAGLWVRPLAPRREIARTLARGARPILPVLLRGTATRRAILRGTVGHPERVPPAAAADLVRAYADAPGFTAANRAMRAGTFPHLRELVVPVTLIWPELDRIVARPRSIPDGIRNRELPGCGHVPMWDDPDAVAEMLLSGSGISLLGTVVQGEREVLSGSTHRVGEPVARPTARASSSVTSGLSSSRSLATACHRALNKSAMTSSEAP